MKLLRYEFLIILVLAALVTGLWNRSPSYSGPELAVSTSSSQLHSQASMDGYRLGQAPDLTLFTDGQTKKLAPFARATINELQISLDHQNERIIELSGGTIELDGKPAVDSGASLGNCKAALGTPSRIEPGCTTWDLSPGVRVYRYASDNDARLHLIAVHE